MSGIKAEGIYANAQMNSKQLKDICQISAGVIPCSKPRWEEKEEIFANAMPMIVS